MTAIQNTSQQTSVTDRHIVLIGGGHTHALFMKRWQQHPIPKCQVTLISDQLHSPYSGMLPGLIAGHYGFSDVHIDLETLCQKSNIRFIQQRVVGLDVNNQSVKLNDNSEVPYDLTSINIGSSPSVTIPGAQEHATPVKPISQFWQRWNEILTELKQEKAGKTLTVIGAGAGGLELILALQHRLQQDDIPGQHEFQLITQNETILPRFPQKLRRRVEKILQHKHIAVSTNTSVRQINAGLIETNQEENLASDFNFLCIDAAPASWPKESELPVDHRGFIEITNQLQVVGFNNVFAVGDIAQQVHHPRPKAGVFAVRQAPFLYRNITNTLEGKPLRKYIPQSHFLSLLSTGDKYAIGSKRQLILQGRWAWYYKDWIDRQFMKQFST